MIHSHVQENTIQFITNVIKQVFPDLNFSQKITRVDGWPNEELDEEQDLYGALYGRKWSEVTTEFIENHPDGLLLVTDEAFCNFLPAWLTCALTNDYVREFMVYSFSPDVHGSMQNMNRRMQLLSPKQRETILSFLLYCLKFESSESVKEQVYHAVIYLKNLVSEGRE